MKKKNLPGPGSYDPKSVFNTQYDSVGINKDRRKPFYDEKQGIPGPGSYSFNDSTIPKNGYSIPHERRGNDKT